MTDLDLGMLAMLILNLPVTFAAIMLLACVFAIVSDGIRWVQRRRRRGGPTIDA